MRSAVAVIAVIFLMVSPAFAADAGKAKGKRSAPSVDEKVTGKSRSDFIVGVIEEVDLSVGRVAVRGRTKRMVFSVSDPSRFRGYKVGDRVSVRYADNAALSVMPIRAKPSSD